MIDSKSNNNVIMDILIFYRLFLDKAIDNPYIPGDLRMVINTFGERTYWSIIKDPYIDLVTPCKMFLGKITGVYNERIYVMDQELSIEELIGDTFSIKLNDKIKNDLIKNWSNIPKLTATVEHNPDLYKVIKRRLDVITKASNNYCVKIKDKIDTETENVWIEVEREANNLDVKDLVKLVLESIEILREIYKDMFGCEDEQQKYEEKDKSNLIDQLRIHVSSIYQLALLFKDKVIWDHIGFSEWWGTSGSFIKLNLRSKVETSIDAYITRKLKESKPNKYDLNISIEAPKRSILNIEDRLKLKPKKDKIYFKKQNLTLTQMIEEIKNIIQIATE